MTYATSGIIGADLTAKSTTAEFALGERSLGSDGTEWVYIQANGAIAQYDAAGIDEDYQAAALTKAIADDAHLPGFAQVAFADNDFGWLVLRGSNIRVNVLASCAADVELFTTGTAGKLDDTSGSQTQLQGVVIITANSTTTSNEECIATNPFFVIAT